MTSELSLNVGLIKLELSCLQQEDATCQFKDVSESHFNSINNRSEVDVNNFNQLLNVFKSYFPVTVKTFSGVE